MRGMSAPDGSGIISVMQQHNRCLFRIAWGILGSREDAEDALQSAYLRAFSSIDSFCGRSSLKTWLTRILINEALMRRRSAARMRTGLATDQGTIVQSYIEKLMGGSAAPAPDEHVVRKQTRGRIDTALAALPTSFRTVFVLREIEELSVPEVAALLGLRQATVKTRHLRAKAKLRDLLDEEFGELLPQTLPFAGEDCARLTVRVVSEWLQSRG